MTIFFVMKEENNSLFATALIVYALIRSLEDEDSESKELIRLGREKEARRRQCKRDEKNSM